jgi:hypothetical protein
MCSQTVTAADDMSPVYDDIRVRYTAGRQEDPSIARQIQAALGDARSVRNVGAGGWSL